MPGPSARDEAAARRTTSTTQGIDEATLPADGIVGPVEVGSVAHGGHCVARLDGRVIFVRHALPGEVVRVRLTDTSHASFWRGDAVEVLQASPGRTTPRCPVAGPGMCGGCDWQHATPQTQRELKASVIREQLAHLAGIDVDVEVEELPGGTFGWRTRMGYVTRDGRATMRRHRSKELVEVPADGCPLAIEAQPNPHALAAPLGPDEHLLRVATSAEGRTSVLVDGVLSSGEPELVEHAAGRDWRVDADGFWQGHPAAADTLVEAVLDGLAPEAGERAFDLYCGVGLFAGALVDAGVQVWGVEIDKRAVELAQANVPQGRFTAGKVDRVVRRMPRATDLVVLDPPRTGAGKDVIDAVASRNPRAIAYVACDPAALGRDLGRLRKQGYELESLRSFDLFPNTHHIECVAICVPAVVI
ncbi:tRNA/tmRNA/rRNA uracil-C5-methylase, TrmA/RlmC/RlmD family [Raineyella antarctica]|uniref:tRNA/tmRNA/rRNA uracil-C5-methylase, TrmA/RlmC/RlmD family n=1 Tax=Raineyella antarctica TaxID=1577474 RepID=A0A1G6GPS0_9ACTN|nr:tRNA/tmRNA/rRNA uracil-C5-methylase, TrmA/RlmC/RlmD family [Raineyella antarctica]